MSPATSVDNPGEPLMAALEERGTHYVARVRNNAVLKRLALPAMDAAVWDALSNGVPAGEPRTWVCESSYRAGSWSRSRRVVQVVVERAGRTHPALLLAADFDARPGDTAPPGCRRPRTVPRPDNRATKRPGPRGWGGPPVVPSRPAPDAVSDVSGFRAAPLPLAFLRSSSAAHSSGL